MAEEPEFSTTVRRTKMTDAVLVPGEVVDDARLSLADLGLYVKLTQWSGRLAEVDLDQMVTGLLDLSFGDRVDVDEAGLRAGFQRLIDAGLLQVRTAREKADQDRKDRGPF
ncbi:hypothetical protein ACIQWZ_38185 [Streptomyces sp. NPDC098077]|uniref:hypothetical protein n=1 Tax=Streptomyces sp. NPDC098077 TaxID=3366093 RepID=UPI003817C63F